MLSHYQKTGQGDTERRSARKADDLPVIMDLSTVASSVKAVIRQL
jgi:hypothetical protein